MSIVAKVSGAIKNLLPKVKVDGSWVDVESGYVKVDGEWKLIYEVKNTLD